MPGGKHTTPQSPEVAKISQATAICLDLMRGRMHRGAVNKCVNLLVHYPEGCSANCAYCGLAKKRQGAYLEKSFIHVDWPVFSMDRIIEAVNRSPSYVERSCISMITNGKCRDATFRMTRRLSDETSLSVSVLVAPTSLKEGDLEILKECGADKIGVAVDLATPELFDLYRGTGVRGPHRWSTYWSILHQALAVFGSPHVGVHLMVGMGEREEELVSFMGNAWGMGFVTHRFSFFAEENSALADRPQPPWPSYLRVQLARHLIEENLSRFDDMRFDKEGRIADFGVAARDLEAEILSGTPFMTTGCLGPGGEVACNRPFGNCLPDVKQWNYPYRPNDEEISLIREHLAEREGTDDSKSSENGKPLKRAAR